jgi:hypothetical protein
MADEEVVVGVAVSRQELWEELKMQMEIIKVQQAEVKRLEAELIKTKRRIGELSEHTKCETESAQRSSRRRTSQRLPNNQPETDETVTSGDARVHAYCSI